MTQAKKKYRVRINYKSGITQDFECDEFEWKSRGSSVTEVKWENCVPDPQFIGVDNIESIWCLR